MNWTISETTDLATCYALRRDVFIIEQSVPEHEEIDGMDSEAIHLLASIDGTPVGTARFLIHDKTAKIGRVCVLGAYRGKGLGVALMHATVASAQKRGLDEARLGAQLHALSFYEALGFEAFGPVFDDAGIDHRMMRKQL